MLLYRFSDSPLLGPVLDLMTRCLTRLSLLLSVLVPFNGVVNNGLVGVQAQYLLGLGTADITGPVVETNMMGYASLGQTDTGLHMRQRSRAFIVADAASPTNRVVFVNAGSPITVNACFPDTYPSRPVDIAMGDTGIRRSILAELATLYGSLYTATNVAISSTHQHSGVGGYLENLLPQVTSLGYVPQTAAAIVAGTVLAIQRAHNSLNPGSLSVGNATVLNANINRSPTAYLANPAEERAQYEFDQDKDMSVLRFNDASGNARGLLSFFPVHGTSLYEVRDICGITGVLTDAIFRLRTTLLSVETTRAWRLTCMNVGAACLR